MPTYDYQCRDCATVIEVIHPMSEDGPSVCELCGGSLRRVIHPAGIIFKGSGFYRTDSRRDSGSSASSGSGSGGSSNGGPSKDGSGSGESSGSDSAGGGESKPAPTKASDSPTDSPKKSGSSSSTE